MIVTTWNIRGWTEAKAASVATLLDRSDVLCITEVWSLPATLNHNTLHALPAPTINRCRRGGGVAILSPPTVAIRHLKSIATPAFQILSASVHGSIVVAAYLSPNAKSSLTSSRTYPPSLVAPQPLWGTPTHATDRGTPPPIGMGPTSDPGREK